MGELKGYDIDGVLSIGVKPEGKYVVISGRTFADYDEFAVNLSKQTPVYIRGVGERDDRVHAGRFKAMMINFLGVTEFYEDDDVQIKVISVNCPNCKIIKV